MLLLSLIFTLPKDETEFITYFSNSKFEFTYVKNLINFGFYARFLCDLTKSVDNGSSSTANLIQLYNTNTKHIKDKHLNTNYGMFWVDYEVHRPSPECSHPPRQKHQCALNSI